jgi:hypothetical protein
VVRFEDCTTPYKTQPPLRLPRLDKYREVRLQTTLLSKRVRRLCWRSIMAAKVGKMVWTGRVLSVLASLLFIMSAAMKLLAPKEIEKGMKPLELPSSLILPLGILELTCVAIYLFPPTAILGAILLTGYIGGAILAHLRAGEAVYIQVALGVVVWLGIFLREERLRKLIPFRR